MTNNNNFNIKATENFEAIVKLFETINTNGGLEPKAKELVDRLLSAQGYSLDLNSNVLNTASENTKVNMLDASAMAAKSFYYEGFSEDVTQEQVDAAKQTKFLYNNLKGVVPAEMQGVLYTMDESYGDQMYIEAKKAYLDGYKNAVNACGASNKGNVS